jgi:uncharacterized protein YegP (UPF0339 family)
MTAFYISHSLRPKLDRGSLLPRPTGGRQSEAIMAHKFEVYKDKAGEYRVRFKYNSEIIFSTEGYSDKSGAKRAIESIKKYVPDAPTEEI